MNVYIIHFRTKRNKFPYTIQVEIMYKMLKERGKNDYRFIYNLNKKNATNLVKDIDNSILKFIYSQFTSPHYFTVISHKSSSHFSPQVL